VTPSAIRPPTDARSAPPGAFTAHPFRRLERRGAGLVHVMHDARHLGESRGDGGAEPFGSGDHVITRPVSSHEQRLDDAVRADGPDQRIEIPGRRLRRR
jgi:hypothetical protein